MNPHTKRIAINLGSGYVPGLDWVVIGAALAADNCGWEIVGVRDGYDGLLRPERYPDGGMVALQPSTTDPATRGGSLGTGARIDPFRVRTANANNAVEEIDRSADVLEALDAAGIGAVVSVVGGSAVTGLHALSVAFKLHRQGLRTVCVPKSAENEIASVPQALGYNSVLSHTAELLDGIRVAASDIGQLAVVEVPGEHAGWLALQAGTAALADAILVPEISYDLDRVAKALDARERTGRHPALVVVAQGARPTENAAAPEDTSGLRASLTPNADPDFGEGERVIDRAGAAAEAVALALQRTDDRDAFSLSLGRLVRGGVATTVDRQLGLAYGAAAVRALQTGQNGVMLSYQPPDITTIPLRQTLNRIRTIPATSELIHTARALGIAFGD